MTRYPELDRPALVYDHGVIPQVVGFLDEGGTPCEYALERAIEKGLLKDGEIRKCRVSLAEFSQKRA